MAPVDVEKKTLGARTGKLTTKLLHHRWVGVTVVMVVSLVKLSELGVYVMDDGAMLDLDGDRGGAATTGIAGGRVGG